MMLEINQRHPKYPAMIHPFPHFVRRNAIDQGDFATFDAVFSQLKLRDKTTYFYKQKEAAYLPGIDAYSDDFLYSKMGSLAKEVMETEFDCAFEDFMTIDFHELKHGYYIDVHNDNPLPGYETHRLVLVLKKSAQGGHFRIHDGEDDPSPMTFDTEPNTWVGMELSGKSFHSVGKVEGDSRKTAIFSLWKKEVKRSASEWAEILTRYLVPVLSSRREDLMRYLMDLGLGRVSHSNRRLLDHKIGCMLILQDLEAEDYLTEAGIMHSLFKLEFIQLYHVSLDVDRLVNLTSLKSVRLAILFSNANQFDYQRILETGVSEHFLCKEFGETFEVDREEAIDILHLDLVNAVEQLGRLGDNACNVLEDLRRLSNFKDLLSPKFAQILDEALGCFIRVIVSRESTEEDLSKDKF